MDASGGRVWSLRPDLELVRVESMDGRPALLVHDPLTGSFDRVEWPESDIVEALRRPVTAGMILEEFRRNNPLDPAAGDIADYLTELGRRGWLRGHAFWPRAPRPGRRSGLLALAARVLFVQIPLVRPESMLKATAGAVRLLFNRATVFLLFLCGLAGLYLALPRWEEYWRDSFGSFGLERLPAFLLALAAVKAVHELAHAYAATLNGARVPVMGVAFFFFMPLPYTDVTDAWRLPWNKRLRVAGAGMAAETALAGAALLLWALSPPGDAAMTLARLSSLAIISTLLTNLNPGPRFDGYYLLVCLFRMENLRPRSVALLRRVVWRRLFGLELPDDETAGGRRRQGAMAAYALYAIAYRASLGCGLALMAYYFLPKAAGILVAVLELWLFLGLPLVNECRLLWRHEGSMRATPYLLALLLLAAGGGVWFFGSWPRRVHFPAVARSLREEAVRTGRSGRAVAVNAQRGQRVERGEVLALMESEDDPPVRRRLEWSLREAELAEEQAWRGDPARRDAATRAAEIRRRRVELQAFRQREEYLIVRAPVSGLLVEWDGDLLPGTFLPRGRPLGRIVDGPVSLLACYPDMETAARLAVGTRVVFFTDDGTQRLAGRVERMEQSRPEILEDPSLARALGAVLSGGALLLPRPYAKVVVRLDSGAARIGQTGTVWAWTEPESLFDRLVLWLRGLAVRESAF